MAYRDDVDALSARQASLEHEVAAKQRELADASRLLAEARARASLPILDNIRVASPCRMTWTAMAETADERIRHCADCNKHVYNLSGMTREEAHQLIAERAGGLCVRYFRRADGTILTSDCDVGHRRTLRKRLAIAGAAVATLTGAAGVLQAVTIKAEEPEHEIVGELRVLDTQLTTHAIDRVMRPAVPELQSCGHGHAGTVRAQVIVRPDGFVDSVAVLEAPDAMVASCVSTQVGKLQFETTLHGGTFIYPIVFRR